MTNEIKRWVIVDKEGVVKTEPDEGYSIEHAWQILLWRYSNKKLVILTRKFLENEGYRAVCKTYREVEE